MKSEKKFLVTGPTGATGGETVEQLLEKGHSVRALAHREDERSERLSKLGAEVVFGDLLDMESVRSALRGIYGAYFVYPIRPGIVDASVRFAQAAKEAGVKIIVNMSQKSARGDSKSDAALAHWLSERVFDWSGVPVSHIRPTLFSEWMLYGAAMIRQGTWVVPFGTGRHAPIAAEDQARVIVGILENPKAHAGKTYPLVGPVECNHKEMSRIIGRVLGKEIRFEQISIEKYGEILRSRPRGPARNTAGTAYAEADKAGGAGSDFVFQHLKEIAIDHQNGIFSGMNNYAQEIGGRPPMTVEQFVEKHRSEFGE
ncbi:MAG: NmrA family NAD(P)-binding protein [Candidatus Acidiferrum sp.]